MPSPTPQCQLLPDVGFVEAEGRDAASFLHAQLSQHVSDLPAGRAPLAGWHDARGRVRALVRLFRQHERWLLATDRGAVDTLLSGLRAFVLRADVRLADLSGNWCMAALIGASREWLAASAVEPGGAAGDVLLADGLHRVRVGPGLIHVAGPAERIAALTSESDANAAEAGAVAEIALGIPSVSPAVAGRYLPQMLNLDRLGAVAFDKGCFPGQEVIARTQNLGSVKRRLRRFCARLPQKPEPGANVLDEHGEPAGEVIRAARAAELVELLAVVRLDALGHPLFVETTPGIPLSEEALPYD